MSKTAMTIQQIANYPRLSLEAKGLFFYLYLINDKQDLTTTKDKLASRLDINYKKLVKLIKELETLGLIIYKKNQSITITTSQKRPVTTDEESSTSQKRPVKQGAKKRLTNTDPIDEVFNAYCLHRKKADYPFSRQPLPINNEIRDIIKKRLNTYTADQIIEATRLFFKYATGLMQEGSHEAHPLAIYEKDYTISIWLEYKGLERN